MLYRTIAVGLLATVSAAPTTAAESDQHKVFSWSTCHDADSDFCHDRLWRGMGYAAAYEPVAGPTAHNKFGAESPRRGAVHIPTMEEACTHNAEVQSKCATFCEEVTKTKTMAKAEAKTTTIADKNKVDATSGTCADTYLADGAPKGLHAPEDHDESDHYHQNPEEEKGPRGYKPFNFPPDSQRPGLGGSGPYTKIPSPTNSPHSQYGIWTPAYDGPVGRFVMHNVPMCVDVDSCPVRPSSCAHFETEFIGGCASACDAAEKVRVYDSFNKATGKTCSPGDAGSSTTAYVKELTRRIRRSMRK
jgi:hypothetical protein